MPKWPVSIDAIHSLYVQLSCQVRINDCTSHFSAVILQSFLHI